MMKQLRRLIMKNAFNSNKQHKFASNNFSNNSVGFMSFYLFSFFVVGTECIEIVQVKIVWMDWCVCGGGGDIYVFGYYR